PALLVPRSMARFADTCRSVTTPAPALMGPLITMSSALTVIAPPREEMVPELPLGSSVKTPPAPAVRVTAPPSVHTAAPFWLVCDPPVTTSAAGPWAWTATSPGPTTSSPERVIDTLPWLTRLMDPDAPLTRTPARVPLTPPIDRGPVVPALLLTKMPPVAVCA